MTDEYFYADLRARLRHMSKTGKLYKLLRTELKAQGLWKKEKPRGRPFKPGHDERRPPDKNKK